MAIWDTVFVCLWQYIPVTFPPLRDIMNNLPLGNNDMNAEMISLHVCCVLPDCKTVTAVIKTQKQNINYTSREKTISFAKGFPPYHFISVIQSQLFCRLDMQPSHVVGFWVFWRKSTLRAVWVESEQSSCTPATNIIFRPPSSSPQLSEIKRLCYPLCTTRLSTRATHNLSSESIDFLSLFLFRSL